MAASSCNPRFQWHGRTNSSSSVFVVCQITAASASVCFFCGWQWHCCGPTQTWHGGLFAFGVTLMFLLHSLTHVNEGTDIPQQVLHKEEVNTTAWGNTSSLSHDDNNNNDSNLTESMATTDLVANETTATATFATPLTMMMTANYNNNSSQPIVKTTTKPPLETAVRTTALQSQANNNNKTAQPPITTKTTTTATPNVLDHFNHCASSQMGAGFKKCVRDGHWCNVKVQIVTVLQKNCTNWPLGVTRPFPFLQQECIVLGQFQHPSNWLEFGLSNAQSP